MMEIRISFNEVFNEVRRNTEVLGQKAGAYDRVRAVKEDDEQMLPWFHDGISFVGVLLDRLNAKPVSIVPDKENATFYLNVTNNNRAQLKDCITRLVTVHMVSLWLEAVAPELVQTSKAEEQNLSQQLVRLAYYREMPR